MFNDRTTPAAFLASRRSAKPRDMTGPGPTPDEMRRILTAAMRVPDHGKLAPWRFVVVGEGQRDDLARLLRRAYAVERETPGRLELEAIEQFARQAPALVVVLSTPVPGSKIPVWEQELSAGAACMNLVAAATAEGFGAGWLTGWAAFSDMVRDAFGGPGARIAGFVFIGTPGRALEERPRPDYDAVVRGWSGWAG